MLRPPSSSVRKFAHASIICVRFSNRSPVRYAASTLFSITCARAISATSRGKLSPLPTNHGNSNGIRVVQTGHEIRRRRNSCPASFGAGPCWTMAFRCVYRKYKGIGTHAWKRAEKVDSRRRQRTLCSLPAFMRAAGIVHTFDVSSISDHSANKTSLVRVAVKMKNWSANADTLLFARNSDINPGTSVYGIAG